ncbi:hypothetical protein [Acinetobacter pittii]|uniref:hypothetical protein n=1 Tax=Acinetobacter pittii TaxID=48296 RepID=UPI000B359BF1|nr:hypothetical protein [Acinetobacter pittii]
MSETSEEKKKRKLIAELRDYQWLYQYSVFPRLEGANREEDKSRAEEIILSGLDKFRDKLRRKVSNIGILFEIRKMNVILIRGFQTQYRRKNFVQIYITFHASAKIEEELLHEIVEAIYGDEVNITARLLGEQDVLGAIEKIQIQALHDFSSYYEIKGRKFNRYSGINRSSFIRKE